MPTNRKRIMVNLPEDVEMWFIKWAKAKRLESLSQAISIILGERMDQENRLIDTFRPPQLAGPERDRTPVYETRPASLSVAQGKSAPKLDQEGR